MENEFVTKTLFWIAGIVFTVLYGLVSFLLAYYFNKNEREKEVMKKQIQDNKDLVENKLSGIIKDFQSGVDSIKSAVTEMKELVSVVRVQHGAELAEIGRRLTNKREWIDELEHKVDDHEKRITLTEADCKHYHKK